MFTGETRTTRGRGFDGHAVYVGKHGKADHDEVAQDREVFEFLLESLDFEGVNDEEVPFYLWLRMNHYTRLQ